MALPRDAMGLSEVCDCGISLSCSLSVFVPVSFLHPNNVLAISVSNINCYMIISDTKYPGHLEHIHSAFEKVFFL